MLHVQLDKAGITDELLPNQKPAIEFRAFLKDKARAEDDDENDFTAYALIQEDKYNAFPEADRKALEDNEDIEIEDVKIKDPNNPAKRLAAKLIKVTF